MIVKVCGMTEAENIRQTERAGAGWIGFIFYPRSPRYVRRMPDYLPEHARRVGVFVNAPTETISDTARQWGLHLVQLHGKESPAQCLKLRKTGLGVIKAFSIADEQSFDTLPDYEETCDFFLFDTPCAAYGGSGRSFDWSLLAAYHGHTPFLLSGGLNPSSAEALAAFSHPQWAGIDLNSGFELAPGIKDTEKLAAFLKQILLTSKQQKP